MNSERSPLPAVRAGVRRFPEPFNLLGEVVEVFFDDQAVRLVTYPLEQPPPEAPPRLDNPVGIERCDGDLVLRGEVKGALLVAEGPVEQDGIPKTVGAFPEEIVVTRYYQENRRPAGPFTDPG